MHIIYYVYVFEAHICLCYYYSPLQARNLLYREVKYAQGHPVNKWQSWDSNSGILTSEFVLLTTWL